MVYRRPANDQHDQHEYVCVIYPMNPDEVFVTVEITTLSPGWVHACPMRDRTKPMPFQTYMNCLWFNI